MSCFFVESLLPGFGVFLGESVVGLDTGDAFAVKTLLVLRDGGVEVLFSNIKLLEDVDGGGNLGLFFPKICCRSKGSKFELFEL